MNKKKIITSAAIGTIALVGLSVSLTLAWYGASDRLKMRSLDVVVAGQTNLKISDSSDLNTFVNDLDLSPAQEEFVFVPVSSMNKKGWMENKSNLLKPQIRQLIGRKGLDLSSVDPKTSACRRIQAADQIHQRRLAGSGRPYNGRIIALTHCEIHIF